MKRFGLLIVVALCATMFSACNAERQAEKLREKIRFESLDEIVPHGLSGVDALISVANETRHKIVLEDAELTLRFRGSEVLTLQLRDAVELPKRFEGQLEISTRMNIRNPLSAAVVLARVRNNQFDEMSVTVDAKAKVGPVRKNIYIAEMELTKFLRKFALTTEKISEI